MLNSILVISYLKAKPLGSQTLLDKCYITLFRLLLVDCVAKGVIEALIITEFEANENLVKALIWSHNFLLDLLVFTFFVLTFTHIGLVKFSWIMEAVDESTFMAAKNSFVVVLSVLETMLSYWLGRVPAIHHPLLPDDEMEIGTAKIVVLALTGSMATAFRIHLACSNHTSGHQTGGLVSNGIVLFSSCLILFNLLLSSLFELVRSTPFLRIFINYILSICVILNKQDLREFTGRKLAKIGPFKVNVSHGGSRVSPTV